MNKCRHGLAELELMYESENIEDLFWLEPIQECFMDIEEAERGCFKRFETEVGEVVHFCFQPNWIMYISDSFVNLDYKNRRQLFCIYRSVTGKCLVIADQWFMDNVTSAYLTIQSQNHYDFYDLLVKKEER